MNSDSVKDICAFVPAKDFKISCDFYEALGFECPDRSSDVRYFKIGKNGFLLQDYYVEEWANNFMMNLHVDDVDSWFKSIIDSNLSEKYPGTRVSQPKLEEWGMIVMHLVDPSGVLWHITQTPKTS